MTLTAFYTNSFWLIIQVLHDMTDDESSDTDSDVETCQSNDDCDPVTTQNEATTQNSVSVQACVEVCTVFLSNNNCF